MICLNMSSMLGPTAGVAAIGVGMSRALKEVGEGKEVVDVSKESCGSTPSVRLFPRIIDLHNSTQPDER